jgi:hypothetical protein
MLWIAFVILLLVWMVAVLNGNVMGGTIHILLVIAIVVMLVRIYQMRKYKK